MNLRVIQYSVLFFALLSISLVCGCAFVYPSPSCEDSAFGDFRFAGDKWDSRVSGHILPYDKPIHLIIFIIPGIIVGLMYRRKGIKVAIVTAFFFFLLGILWEIKDGFVYWEYAPSIGIGNALINLGGDGFSWKDQVMNLTGLIIGFIPLIYKHKISVNL